MKKPKCGGCGGGSSREFEGKGSWWLGAHGDGGWPKQQDDGGGGGGRNKTTTVFLGGLTRAPRGWRRMDPRRWCGDCAWRQWGDGVGGAARASEEWRAGGGVAEGTARLRGRGRAVACVQATVQRGHQVAEGQKRRGSRGGGILRRRGKGEGGARLEEGRRQEEAARGETTPRLTRARKRKAEGGIGRIGSGWKGAQRQERRRRGRKWRSGERTRGCHNNQIGTRRHHVIQNQ